MEKEILKKNFGIVYKSKKMRDLIDIALQVAQSDISVLLYGESGVGKEVFAKVIHKASKRADKPLVSINCGAIPEGILESELFGHKKGSFTGAVDNRKGYFEIADGGTLFLDEIGEMPLTTQVKLLRVLETQEIMPVGSETVKKVDVRIIAASNRDLQKEVDAKRFRQDLYFRLKAVTLVIPPLRERKEDIPELVEYFLKQYSEKNNIPLPELTRDAMELLMDYPWPGNIRELKNTLESAVALSKDGILDSEAFLPLLTSRQIEEDPRHLPVHVHKSADSMDREMILGALIEIKKDLNELKGFAYKNQNTEINNPEDVEMEEIIPLDELEKNAIKKALKFTKGNKRKAAQLLKISERTLYRKIKEYGIS